MSNMKTIYGFLVLLAVFCVGASVPTQEALAITIRSGESVVFEPYTTIDDDLYAFGHTFTMRGTTTGDVFAAGIQPSQSGTVMQDTLYVGGVVTINGETYGDARGMGGKVHVYGNVSEDVVYVGGDIVIEDPAVIEGDALLIGETVTIKGAIQGLVTIYAKTVSIEGSLGNRVEIHAQESVSVVEDAEIHGDVVYSAPREAFISETTKIDGEVTFSKQTVSQESNTTFFTTSAMYVLLITVLAALFIFYLFPSQTKQITNTALKKDVALHALIALGVLIITPVLATMLAITIVGILPALILMCIYLATVLIAVMLAPVVAGVVLLKLLKKEEKLFEIPWISLGAIIFGLLAFIPILGWFIRFTIFLVALYGIVACLHMGIWKKRNTLVTNESAEQEVSDTHTHEEAASEDRKG